METYREPSGKEAAPSGSAAPRGNSLLDRLAHRPVRTPAGVLLACGAGLLLIFGLDYVTPGEMHPEMLYALVILGGLWTRRAALILVLSLLTNVCIVLGYLLSPLTSSYWIALVNRGFAVILVWAVAALVYVIERTLDRLEGNRP